ncbi:MAG: 1-deoxy-D-xylulose-5-phosphate reductoisomerase [Thermodesulfobacteriota bacterium]|nr:1-deoxy-D-xylulose-5-phosphate reductoisomerase [Thermodesulfobacteriota bacterium]
MKNICLLGSTGYIGINALNIIRGNPGRYNIISLGAGENADLLLSQIKEFKPKYAAIINNDLAEELKKKLNNFTSTKILWGNDGYAEIATLPEIDLVIGAMSGFSGLPPIYSAITACKDVALANKESLVVAGSLLMSESKKRGVKIFPIDSEHSAIQQSMQGHNREDLKKIILTGSGGPFRNFPIDRLTMVKPEEALKHPNWRMGMKITIDSATLMNKGLEAIEAKWLFNLEMDQIEILIHPQSIIHSMVEYMDGSIIAQLSTTDMRIPIAYALSYPRHLKGDTEPLNLLDVANLSFEKPDKEKFKCLDLALTADKAGGSMMSVLNGANEIAVNAFLQGKIGFMEIPELIERTMENHEIFSIDSIDKAIEADQWARTRAKKILNTWR